MNFTAFLDDSSDQQQEKVVVYGGFVGDLDKWVRLKVLWKANLRHHGIRYFRSTECKALQGEFVKFRSVADFPKPAGRQAADAVRNDLMSVIETCGIVGFAVGVLVQDYREVLKLPEAKGRLNLLPDETAFQSVMFECAKRLREELPGKNKVRFICDHSDKARKLRAIYVEFRKKNPKTAGVLGGFGSRDDKTTPGLQAADLMAGLAKDLLMRKLEGGQRPGLTELSKSVALVAFWDKDYTLSGLNDLIAAEKDRSAARADAGVALV
jgi:Protein of unknown function (DUF3800)